MTELVSPKQNNPTTHTATSSSAEANGNFNKNTKSNISESGSQKHSIHPENHSVSKDISEVLQNRNTDHIVLKKNIKEEQNHWEYKTEQEQGHNGLIKNDKSKCVHNSDMLNVKSENSIDDIPGIKSDTKMSASIKESLHATAVSTDVTNNNDPKANTPNKAKTMGFSTSEISNMHTGDNHGSLGHYNYNGFISMEQRNGHVEKQADVGQPFSERKALPILNDDYEDDDHMDLIIDEGVDKDPPSRRGSSDHSRYLEKSTSMQALTRDFSGSQFHENMGLCYPSEISPTVTQKVFPYGMVAAPKTSQKKTAVSPIKSTSDTLKASNATGVKPRCAPVREAVDPAKYITVQEGDGVKYACSKCGNIYKWRKSLNKHWKEKHDGEIPEPRSSVPTIPIPRVSATAAFHSSLPRANCYSGMPQVSPRSLPTSPKEKAYVPSVSRSGGFPSNPFSPTGYGSASKTYGEVSVGKLYSTSTPKGLSPGLTSKKSLESYLIGSSQRQQPGNPKFSTSAMMQYHTKKSPTKLPQEKLIKPQAPRSPPAAHSNKPTPQYIPPRPTSTEVPVDLTRELILASKRHTESEHVLDLSKKTLYNISTVEEPPQDEPLDFSQKPIDTKKNIGAFTSSAAKNDYNTKTIKSGMYVTPALSKVAEPLKLLACSMCTYTTRSQSDLELHKELHSNDSQYFLCAECHETCTSLESLNQHFSSTHMGSLAKHHAELQKENSKASSSDLQNSSGPQLYKYLTMENSRNTMSCIVCGIIYQWQWALAKHFEQDHATLPNPYEKEKVAQDDHPTSPASPQDGKTVQCHSCSFVAGTKSELLRHQIRHSLNKHHVCKVCGYTAKVQGELTEHYANEHPNIDPKNLKSSTGTVILTANGDDSDGSLSEATEILGPDGKSLIEFSGENTAIVIPQAPEDSNANQGNNRSKAGRKPNTGNSPSSVDVLLPYKCSSCEYRARWPSEITQHMKNHSDEKPFHCPRCTYKSKWKWDVVKHLKRCGGGTVKDVIDTTKLKRNPDFKTLFEIPDSMNYNQPRELSNGPPNVTVVPDGSVERASYHSRSDNNQSYLSEEEEMNLSPDSKHSEASVMFPCNMCTYIGDSDKKLSHHMLVHLEEKPYTCIECDYSFKSKGDLQGHCKTHNHQYDSDCSEPRNMKYIEHAESDNQAEESTGDESIGEEMVSYICELCPFSTTKKSFFQAHLMKHRDPNKISFPCKQCDVETSDLTSFLQHKLTHSDKSKSQVSEFPMADDCAADEDGDLKESGGSSRRKQPKKTIVKTLVLDDEEDHVSDEYPAVQDMTTEDPLFGNSSMYICQYCPYVTNNRANFDRHMPHHESESKYRCEWCNWSSDRLNVLYRHVQIVHPGNVPKQDKEAFYAKVKDRSSFESYSSPNEKTAFDSHFDDLKQSKYADTPGGVKRGNVFSEGKKTKRRLKTCGKCGYVTDNVTTLQRHMAKHGKNGKYTCTSCDYSVDKQHVLDYHNRLVHAKKSPNPAIVMGTLEPDNTSNSTVDFNDNVSNGNSSNGENIADDDSVNFEEADTSTVQGEDVKIVHVGTRTVYGCTKCPYHTMKISGVLNHSRQHGQKKKYTCTYCDYSVDQSAHVKNHMKTVHGHNAEFISNQEIETLQQEAVEIDNYDVASNGNDSELQEDDDDINYQPGGKKQRFDTSEVKKTNLSSVYRCSKCSHTAYNKVEWMKHKLVHMDDSRSTISRYNSGVRSITQNANGKSDFESDASTEDDRNNLLTPATKNNDSIDINSNTALANHV